MVVKEKDIENGKMARPNKFAVCIHPARTLTFLFPSDGVIISVYHSGKCWATIPARLTRDGPGVK